MEDIHFLETIIVINNQWLILGSLGLKQLK